MSKNALMRTRIFVSLVVLLSAISLSAQSNQVGVFFTAPSFKTTSTTDSIGTVKFVFDRRTGYGVSLDHFLSPDTAFHLSWQKLRANVRLEFPDQGGTSIDSGTMDLNEYTAALHWYFLSQRDVVRPFFGAGIARVQGGKLNAAAVVTSSTTPDSVSLDSKTTWTADAGFDIRIGASGAVTGGVQYTPYKTHFGAAPGTPVQFLKLNPTTFTAGLRWQF